MKSVNVLFLFYAISVFALFLYSFTQVDLSLTWTRFEALQAIQQKFQYIGFFKRPLSTAIFSLILASLCLFYLLFLYLSKRNLVSKKVLFSVIFFTTILLSFSYNAFSYDLFNYIFDAKIVTHYH